MLNLKNRDFETAEGGGADAMVSKSPNFRFPTTSSARRCLVRAMSPVPAKPSKRRWRRRPIFSRRRPTWRGSTKAAGDRDAARDRYLGDSGGISLSNAGAHLALADLSVRMGDLAAAREHLEAVVAANPDSLRGQIGLARLFLRQNRLEEAEAPAAQFSDAPDLLDGLLLNADLALRMGDRNAARATGSVCRGG